MPQKKNNKKPNAGRGRPRGAVTLCNCPECLRLWRQIAAENASGGKAA